MGIVLNVVLDNVYYTCPLDVCRLCPCVWLKVSTGIIIRTSFLHVEDLGRVL